MREDEKLLGLLLDTLSDSKSSYLLNLIGFEAFNSMMQVYKGTTFEFPSEWSVNVLYEACKITIESLDTGCEVKNLVQKYDPKIRKPILAQCRVLARRLKSNDIDISNISKSLDLLKLLGGDSSDNDNNEG